MLDAASGCAGCLATGPLQEVLSWWGTAGEDVAASTAAGSRAASASGRPSPQPGLLKYLLLRLQCQMPSVRFGCAEQSHNENKAGDVLEAVGGFLRPWNKRAEVVSVRLGRVYGWSKDEVQDALRSLTNFTEAASCLWAHASADKAEFASLLSRFGGSRRGDFSAAGCDCITCAVRLSASFSAIEGPQPATSQPPRGPSPRSAVLRRRAPSSSSRRRSRRRSRCRSRLPQPSHTGCCSQRRRRCSSDSSRATRSSDSGRSSCSSSAAAAPVAPRATAISPPAAAAAAPAASAPAPAAPSSSSSGSRQRQAPGPPCLSEERDGSDVPAPFAATAENRVPPQVCDQRFSRKRSLRVARCDGCLKVFSGSGKGSFVARTCAVSAGERRRLWDMG